MLQFVLQDLKIALANTPSVHPLFVLYCIVYYESVCVFVCGGGGVGGRGFGTQWTTIGAAEGSCRNVCGRRGWGTRRDTDGVPATRFCGSIRKGKEPPTNRGGWGGKGNGAAQATQATARARATPASATK